MSRIAPSNLTPASHTGLVTFIGAGGQGPEMTVPLSLAAESSRKATLREKTGVLDALCRFAAGIRAAPDAAPSLTMDRTMRNTAAVWAMAAGLAFSAHSAGACNLEARIDPYRPLSLIAQDVHARLHARDFAGLDKLAALYSGPHVMTTDGQDKMLGLISGLSVRSCGKAADDLEEHRQLAGEWQAHAARREVPGLVLAQLESDSAWALGGGDYAGRTAPERMEAFIKHQKNALAMLDAMGPGSRRFPFWYELRLNLANSLGWEAQRYNQLFDQATAAFPGYVPFYHAKMDYLDPKWHGTREEVLTFIAQSERKQRKRFGRNVLYALLNLSTKTKAQMFTAEGVNLEQFSDGMERWIARYPDPYTRNRYALLACENQLYTLTGEQMLLIGEKISTTTWRNPAFLAACQKEGAIALAARSARAP